MELILYQPPDDKGFAVECLISLDRQQKIVDSVPERYKEYICARMPVRTAFSNANGDSENSGSKL